MPSFAYRSIQRKDRVHADCGVLWDVIGDDTDDATVRLSLSLFSLRVFSPSLGLLC